MPDANATSRMLTLVFTDLANSTALKTQHGDTAVGELIRRHRELIVRLAGECSGRIIDWAGDGCFLTFEVSSAGVLFGLRLQQAHADQPDLPQVRVGVHLGEVTERLGPGGDVRVEGLAVDIAARIGGLARPGQVLMSSAVYHSARQRLGVETLGKPVLWQTHGPYTFKGFDEPLDISEAALEGVTKPLAPDAGDKAQPAGLSRRLLRQRMQRDLYGSRGSRWTPRRITILIIIVVAIIASRFPESGPPKHDAPTSEASTPISSLAVLPLENLSDDPDQEYFADGMTEAITSELSKIKALRITSRTSAMKYKTSDQSASEIGGELRVDGLIEGSVQREGGDVQITVTLIRAATDDTLWTHTYRNTLTSVLSLQSEVALAIADELQAELTGGERQQLARKRNVNAEAHDEYLLGIHFLDQLSGDGLRASVRYFEEATRLDPTFAEAWARLAGSYRYLTGFGFASPKEAFEKARAADLRALEIDPNLSLAHEGLARTLWSYDREFAKAEEMFREILISNPNSANAHNSYALYLTAMGRRAEAIEHAARALELDPDDAWTIRNAQMSFLYSGAPARGRVELDRLVAARPDFIPAHVILVGTYGALGDMQKSIATAEQWVELSDRSAASLVGLSDALARVGETSRAAALLEEASGRADESFSARASMAYALLGDFDRAFDQMEKSFEIRDFGVFWFRTLPYRLDLLDHPNMVRFRTSDRFHTIIEQMGYPPLPQDHPGHAEEQAWLAKKSVN